MVTFNINLFSINKSYFRFPGLSSVTMATSLSGFSKVKSELIFEESTKNTSKYIPNFSEISQGFGSYEHLKFMPTHQLKYRL